MSQTGLGKHTILLRSAKQARLKALADIADCRGKQSAKQVRGISGRAHARQSARSPRVPADQNAFFTPLRCGSFPPDHAADGNTPIDRSQIVVRDDCQSSSRTITILV